MEMNAAYIWLEWLKPSTKSAKAVRTKIITARSCAACAIHICLY